MTCTTSQELIGKLAVGELRDDPRAADLVAHINSCADCRGLLEDMRATVGLLEQAATIDAVPVLDEPHRAVLGHAIAQAQSHTVPTDHGVGPRSATVIPFHSALRVAAVVAVLAVAAALLTPALRRACRATPLARGIAAPERGSGHNGPSSGRPVPVAVTAPAAAAEDALDSIDEEPLRDIASAKTLALSASPQAVDSLAAPRAAPAGGAKIGMQPSALTTTAAPTPRRQTAGKAAATGALANGRPRAEARDAGLYATVRDDLQAGRLPSPAAVRTEDFLARFGNQAAVTTADAGQGGHSLRALQPTGRTIEDSPDMYLAACAAEFADVLRNPATAPHDRLERLEHLLGQIQEHLPDDPRAGELLGLVRRASHIIPRQTAAD